MPYHHTQKAPLFWLLLAVAVLFLACAGATDGLLPWFFACMAIGMVLLAFMFKQLTISDQEDHLSLRYGPLPLLGKRIPYASIASAARDRSALIDGFGIHYVPGRGTTYNLWGFDCVKLTVNGRTIRVGTDDAENLVACLQDRLTSSTRE